MRVVAKLALSGLFAVLCVLLALGADESFASSGATAPLIQQGGKLTPEGELGDGGFGGSVALSADGRTAVIGAPGDDERLGAAWVYVREGSSWVQQGKLTGGEAESGGGPDGVSFGASAAISADGKTVLIGGFGDDGERGAAWVFTREGASWQQQGPKLTVAGEGATAQFGYSVALSGDGSTALIGARGARLETGAAWVFTREGATWTQQSEGLSAEDESGHGRFGDSVALSADGDTALVGGPNDHSLDDTGAAWIFTREGTGWTQQGEKLTGGGETEGGQFGDSVALAADGQTALVGGAADGEYAGAAWAFAREGETWAQQGEKLTSGGATQYQHFGASLALSGDGSLALVGAYGDSEDVGAAWVFDREGASLVREPAKLTGASELEQGIFGERVALSAGGHTALIGGPDDGGSCCSDPGAAWAFSDGLDELEGTSEEVPGEGSETNLIGGVTLGGGGSGPGAGLVAVNKPSARGGLDAASSSSARLARLFTLALRPSGKKAKIGALLAAGGFVTSLSAFAPGAAAIAWYQPAKASSAARRATAKRTQPLLVASGKVFFRRAGRAGIEIKLTRAGRRLLARSKRLGLTAKGTFTPNGAGAIAATRTFVLTR